MTDQHTLTIKDQYGRLWTIVTERAVVGFRWRVYLHGNTVGVAALELVHPGGVAHGWTDDDRTEENARAWLGAAMRIKGAVEEAFGPRSATVGEAVTVEQARDLAQQWAGGGRLDHRLLGWVERRMETIDGVPSAVADGVAADLGISQRGAAALCELAGWPS